MTVCSQIGARENAPIRRERDRPDPVGVPGPTLPARTAASACRSVFHSRHGLVPARARERRAVGGKGEAPHEVLMLEGVRPEPSSARDIPDADAFVEATARQAGPVRREHDTLDRALMRVRKHRALSGCQVPERDGVVEAPHGHQFRIGGLESTRPSSRAAAGADRVARRLPPRRVLNTLRSYPPVARDPHRARRQPNTPPRRAVPRARDSRLPRGPCTFTRPSSFPDASLCPSAENVTE